MFFILAGVYHHFGGTEDVSPRQAKKRMTVQMGLFGRDGMLLAGDTCGSTDDYLTTEQSKFLYNEGMENIVAQSGFSDALLAARMLVDQNWNGDRVIGEKLASEAYRIGNPLPSTFRDQPTTRILVMRPKERRICLVEIHSHSIITEHTEGKLLTGERAAQLFLEQYYSSSFSLEKLKRLAAFVIWLTGHVAPHLVRGLEMIECPDGQNARRVSKTEIARLQRWSETTHGRIEKLITSPSRASGA